MLLIDRQIIEWAKSGGVSPYDLDAVNPASIDLHLGSYWYDFENRDEMQLLDELWLWPDTIGRRIYNFFFRKSQFCRPHIILAMTYERISIPPNMAASVKLKTTPTRKGLGQIIGDWVDPGFEGNLTLMLYAHARVKLSFKQPICQLVLYKLESSVDCPYSVRGHYNNISRPTFAWDEKR